jgi:hypothetical protein
MMINDAKHRLNIELNFKLDRRKDRERVCGGIQIVKD